MSWASRAASCTHPSSPGGDRHQATTARMAHPTSHGRQLGEGLRQGLRLAGGDHDQQSARVPAFNVGSPTTTPGASRRWCPMRKGVSDLWRNYQVGIAANHRYLDALAVAPLKGEGVAALDALCRPRTNGGRRYARFSPLSPTDLALFRAAMAGEHAIQGFRNTDLTRRLYRRPPTDRDEAHRRCERVSTAHRQTPRTRPRRQDPHAPVATESPATASAS